MYKFNKTYDLILEGIFEPASDEDLAQRKKDAPKIIAQEWIEKFLKRTDIHKNEDGSYDVDGDIDTSVYAPDNFSMKELPIKLNLVTGYVDVSNLGLTTLKNSPRKIGKTFWADNNNLTNLEGAPIEVGISYIVQNNELTNLKGAPPIINGNFHAAYNKLTSLEGAPKEVKNEFNIEVQDSKIQFSIKDVKKVVKARNIAV